MSSWEMEQTRSSEMEENVVLARFTRAASSSWLLEDEDGESMSKTLAALPLSLLLSPALRFNMIFSKRFDFVSRNRVSLKSEF